MSKNQWKEVRYLSLAKGGISAAIIDFYICYRNNKCLKQTFAVVTRYIQVLLCHWLDELIWILERLENGVSVHFLNQCRGVGTYITLAQSVHVYLFLLSKPILLL